MGCVFCKIAAGEIAATVVKRGDGMLAFQDLSPQAPTHLLVIPTYHVGTLNEVTDAGLLGRLLGFARDVAREAGIADRVTSPPVRRDLPFVPPLHEVERGSGGEGTGGEVGVARAPGQG